MDDFDYEEFTAEEAQEALNKYGSGGDYFKAKEGKNILRFVPPTRGNPKFVMSYQHFVSQTNGDRAIFPCLAKHKSEPCPACDIARKLSASPHSVDQEQAKAWWPRTQTVAYVIDRENPEAGPQIFRYGFTIQKALAEIADAGGDYYHPIEGFDIVLKRHGTGMRTEYTVTAKRKTSPLAEDKETVRDWMEAASNLKNTIKFLGYDAIVTKIGGPIVDRPQLEAAEEEFEEYDDDDDADYDD